MLLCQFVCSGIGPSVTITTGKPPEADPSAATFLIPMSYGQPPQLICRRHAIGARSPQDLSASAARELRERVRRRTFKLSQ